MRRAAVCFAHWQAICSCGWPARLLRVCATSYVGILHSRIPIIVAMYFGTLWPDSSSEMHFIALFNIIKVGTVS